MDYHADTPKRGRPDTYDSAMHLAERYRHLERLHEETDPRRGYDLMKALEATYLSGSQVSDWTPRSEADELVTIRVVMRMAVDDMTRERPDEVQAYWRCWMERRIQSIPPTQKPGGYSRTHVYRVLDIVDTYIEDALFYHDLLTPRPDDDEEMIEAPRVRVYRNPGAFDPEEQKEEEEVAQQ